MGLSWVVLLPAANMPAAAAPPMLPDGLPSCGVPLEVGDARGAAAGALGRMRAAASSSQK